MVDRPNSLAARDIAYYFHPATNARRHEQVGPMMIERGEGVRVWDDQGKEYIEGLAGLWSVAVGFGEEQAGEGRRRADGEVAVLPFVQPQIAPQRDKAGRAARQSRARHEQSAFHVVRLGGERPHRQDDLVLQQCARPPGEEEDSRRARRAITASPSSRASLTGLPNFHRDFDLPLPFVRHLSCPNFWRFGLAGRELRRLSRRVWPEELEAMILAEGPETVAAFIGEPVMGAGGVMPPPRTYWEKIQTVLPQIRRFAGRRRSDHRLWAHGRICSPVRPMGSSPISSSCRRRSRRAIIPLSAILFTDKIYQTLADNSAKIGVFAHGFTASGHPVGTAIATRKHRHSSRKKTLSAPRGATRPQFQERLQAFASHPKVGEARGIGMIGALEFVADKATKAPFDPPGSCGAPDRRTLPRGRPHHPRDRRHHCVLPAAGHHAGGHRRIVRPLRARAQAALADGRAPPTKLALLHGPCHDGASRRKTERPRRSRRWTGVARWLAGPARREASFAKHARRVQLAADGGGHRAAAGRRQHLDAAPPVSLARPIPLV